jgi:K+-transporting ATPase ATPase B chain
METSTIRKGTPASALFDPRIVVPAISAAFVKLNPRTLMKNPVMFVLEIVTMLTTCLDRDLVTGAGTSALNSRSPSGCGSPSCSRISGSRAEGAASQADALRRQRTETKQSFCLDPTARATSSSPLPTQDRQRCGGRGR